MPGRLVVRFLCGDRVLAVAGPGSGYSGGIPTPFLVARRAGRGSGEPRRVTLRIGGSEVVVWSRS